MVAPRLSCSVGYFLSVAGRKILKSAHKPFSRGISCIIYNRSLPFKRLLIIEGYTLLIMDLMDFV